MRSLPLFPPISGPWHRVTLRASRHFQYAVRESRATARSVRPRGLLGLPDLPRLAFHGRPRSGTGFANQRRFTRFRAEARRALKPKVKRTQAILWSLEIENAVVRLGNRKRSRPSPGGASSTHVRHVPSAEPEAAHHEIEKRGRRARGAMPPCRSPAVSASLSFEHVTPYPDLRGLRIPRVAYLPNYHDAIM